MRVLVTGATGNVGTAVLRRLLAEPAVTSVAGLARRRVESGEVFEAVQWELGDLSSPASDEPLRRRLREVDAVVHLAWLIQPSHDEPTMHRTNVDGARRLLEACVAAKVDHVVVLSSVGAYSPGPKDHRVSESWPTAGVASSSYSRHKAQVERLMDRLEPSLRALTRLRPGLVFQRTAATEIARYFLGPLVPTGVFGRLPLPALPLPRQLVFQAVHADDVAAAVAQVLDSRATGAYNVAAEPVLTPDHLALAIGAARAVPLPLPVLRAAAAATWHARLQPTAPGWLDLAASVPLMATDRLRELGWTPQRGADDSLDELVAGMREGAGDRTPPLHP